MDLAGIAAQVQAAQDACSAMAPLTSRHPAFGLDDAYAVAARVHHARVAAGAKPRGRKIGFTNANIWPEYDVHHPIWGHVYEHTLVQATEGQAQISLRGLAEPKIEPEIAFGLRSAPPAGADLPALADCIEWVAPAFEIVQSHYPGWKFKAADTIADGGLHGRLVLGTRVTLSALGADAAATLARLSIELHRDGQAVETGHGRNVLGGPVSALAHLLGFLATQGPEAALRAGEVVTTGTVTAAYGIAPGQAWQMRPTGVLSPLRVTFTA